MDKGLFFFILASLCLWLVLDDFYGNKYIDQFIVKAFPGLEKSSFWDFFKKDDEED